MSADVASVAWSLWAWDELRLELGDAAVIAVGKDMPAHLPAIALLHGALPVLQIGGERAPEGVEIVAATDAGSVLSELRRRLERSVGAAAVDFSGKAEVVDALFEGLPRFARLLLAAHGDNLTIDFYNNVHRKGVLLRSHVCDPARFAADPSRAGYLQRARRLVDSRPELFAA
jgi:hypothetical protein